MTTTRVMLARTMLGMTAALLVAAASGQAQSLPWEDRGFIDVGVGREGGADDVRSTRSFGVFGETATFDERYPVGGGTVFSVTGGARIWRNLGGGAGFTRVSDTADASLTGSVPHPLFFNSPIQTGTNARGLTRTETAIHFMVLWNVIVTDRIDVMFSGGPSVIKVSQDVVTGITIAQGGGPLEVVARPARTGVLSDSAAGFNVGVQANYRFWETLGAGLFIRYVGGSVDLRFDETGGDAAVSSGTGGGQVGLALRLYF